MLASLPLSLSLPPSVLCGNKISCSLFQVEMLPACGGARSICGSGPVTGDDGVGGADVPD